MKVLFFVKLYFTWAGTAHTDYISGYFSLLMMLLLLSAIYCIGIFALMMLSLLETILVMYLMEQDIASEDNEADKDPQGKMNFHSCHRGETWKQLHQLFVS